MHLIIIYLILNDRNDEKSNLKNTTKRDYYIRLKTTRGSTKYQHDQKHYHKPRSTSSHPRVQNESGFLHAI